MRRRAAIRLRSKVGIAIAFVMAALGGAASGVVFALAGDLPQIATLDEDYSPSTITRVYGSRGELIGEFSTERRVVVGYDEMSPILRNAILAAEDVDFESHFGLSVVDIMAATARNALSKARELATGRYSRPKGASTITQQLARSLFGREVGYEIGDVSPVRKIREALVAIEIEKRYTKREIFEMYANQIYLGEGAYGVEAAARTYFGKSAKDVNLDEAATIAGLFQTWRNAPTVSMARAKWRQAYVLQQMADAGFISRDEAEAARARPIVLARSGRGTESAAPYFLEEVRKQLESRYGPTRLYEAGLSVRTTLDVELQDSANRALDAGLRRIDRIHGFRPPTRNVIAEGQSLETFQDPRWKRQFTAGDIIPAVVSAVGPATIELRAGEYRIAVDRKGYAWTRKTPAQLVKTGDLVEARLVDIDHESRAATASLEQPPLVEGAVVAIDNQTGQIKAMAGGWSFERSRFNRATQALRQVGSAFKPFVYATAIDRGYTPASIIEDAPASFESGAGQPAYDPQNFEKDFWGPITLRRALEHSRNLPTVRLMDALGPGRVVVYARRFGLTAPVPPYLSVALGAAEQTLLDMTTAYSVFPNQGVRAAPYSIVEVSDREGNVLEENRPASSQVIRADTAYVMTSLLRGVVQRGTAFKASSLNWPIGGKTGTTDDYSDAWFIGFDTDLTLGVWVGYDLKKGLGSGMTGSEAALPIWIEIFRSWIGDRRDPPAFKAPANIVFTAVDAKTGDAVEPGTPGAITETFIAGTEPNSFKR